jgi:periplasmic protein TonB
MIRLLFVIGSVLTLTVSAVAQEAKKVSQSEATSAAVSKVQPEYPPMAKQLRISGAVELEASVNEEGAVDNVRVVSGNPVLTKAATTALLKWRFKPFTNNGAPVKALATLTFDFKAQQ